MSQESSQNLFTQASETHSVDLTSFEPIATSTHDVGTSTQTATPSKQTATPFSKTETPLTQNATPSTQNATPVTQNATQLTQNATPVTQTETQQEGHNPFEKISQNLCSHFTEIETNLKAALFDISKNDLKSAIPTLEKLIKLNKRSRGQTEFLLKKMNQRMTSAKQNVYSLQQREKFLLKKQAEMYEKLEDNQSFMGNLFDTEMIDSDHEDCIPPPTKKPSMEDESAST